MIRLRERTKPRFTAIYSPKSSKIIAEADIPGICLDKERQVHRGIWISSSWWTLKKQSLEQRLKWTIVYILYRIRIRPANLSFLNSNILGLSTIWMQGSFSHKECRNVSWSTICKFRNPGFASFRRVKNIRVNRARLEGHLGIHNQSAQDLYLMYKDAKCRKGPYALYVYNSTAIFIHAHYVYGYIDRIRGTVTWHTH